ncbi:MAG: hypothetical protein C0508_24235, partial [Cyanobacteria bacterium PR.023]|nr:hypothetical protein [Cyanobacteria bacterium PR.023]
MSDSSELDKRKAAAKAPPAQAPDLGQDPASGYSFFVNEPGNSQYNYGLDVSLSAPVSIPGYTAYAPTPAAPP